MKTEVEVRAWRKSLEADALRAAEKRNSDLYFDLTAEIRVLDRVLGEEHELLQHPMSRIPYQQGVHG